MKSRCMSMIRSAVDDHSRSIGSGSAASVPLEGPPEFAMTTHPERMNSGDQRSKARAIVYNGGPRVAPQNPAYFQMVEARAVGRSISKRSFYDLHLLNC
jgi:hypothetical protein